MSYSTSVTIRGNSRQVFDAIAKNVQQWWGFTNNPVSKSGDTFTTSFDKTFWTFRISEYKPNTRIVWHCIDARHIHSGYNGIEKEWIGTSVEWEIVQAGEDETLLHFSHNGLVPELNCYEICYPAWERFVTQSLKSFVESGEGMPHLS